VTLTDEQVAMLFGRTENAVRLRRIRLGIVTKKLKRRQWSPTEDQLLGTAPDSEIAQRLGCN
jgi:hypothetical protein